MGDVRQNRLSTWLSVIAILISVAALFHQVQLADEARRLQVAQKRTELLSRTGIVVAKLEFLVADVGRIKTVVTEALSKPMDPMTGRTLEISEERIGQMETICLDMEQKLSNIHGNVERLSGEAGIKEVERITPLLGELEFRVEETTKAVREIEDATWDLIDTSAN